jgi:hypothetical protein
MVFSCLHPQSYRGLITMLLIVVLFISVTHAFHAFQYSILTPSNPRRLLQRRHKQSPGSNTNNRHVEVDLALAQTKTVTVEVCTSPGCLADGAKDTLLKLQALAPSSVKVCEGGCRSLCGNGPVVIVDETKTMRKIKGNEKVLSVLSTNRQNEITTEADDDPAADDPGTVFTPEQNVILQALDLLDKARGQHDTKNLDAANDLYNQAIELGMKFYGDQSSLSIDKMAWLIESLQSQADCLSALKRYGDAADAAKSAVNVCDSSSTAAAAAAGKDTSDKRSDDTLINYLYGSLERCQAALESAKTDAARKEELDVLDRFLALPQPQKISVSQQNKRRSLGFRFQKLQRELS